MLRTRVMTGTRGLKITRDLLKDDGLTRGQNSPSWLL